MPTYSHPGVYVEEVPSAVRPIAGVGTSIAGFIGVAADIKGPWDAKKTAGMPLRPDEEPYVQAEPLIPQPINSWTDFTQAFGDLQPANQYLAHAVYGFFNNGGSRCWVTRSASPRHRLRDQPRPGAAAFEAIDEIAIVAAPLPPDTAADVAHGGPDRGDRALREHAGPRRHPRQPRSHPDGPAVTPATVGRPPSDKGYGAFYFPWIEVTDPLGEPPVLSSPSRRAGTWPGSTPAATPSGACTRRRPTRCCAARSRCATRSARTCRTSQPRRRQLHPLVRRHHQGVRRTDAGRSGGDPEWTYVNVRRLVNFLRESIDEGTQWVVFEPNAPELWSRIRRNVGAFLNGVWASGALLGATADQAYYVRCDETTNPPEVRELGQVVTEIGVAIVRPAEFVIFRLSQWAGPGQ